MKIFLTLILMLCSINALELNNFNNYKCDKVIDNSYFKTCYDYNLKSATASYTLLQGDKVNSLNIKERFDFYDDQNIPKEFRTFDHQYTNSGFDRGHIEGDASFDYSAESLKFTYALSNIVPQYPKTNRHSYLNVEKYQREKAQELQFLEVLTLIEYTDEKVNKMSIPKVFNVVLYNKNIGFEECYSIKNDNIVYSLDEMKVNCSSMSSIIK